ncbi:hypothetical protein HDU83_008729 [Entophlyctis luteolus]|nr:hypothetical protein HDU83_008729 [Entophlyctis luteolus]
MKDSGQTTNCDTTSAARVDFPLPGIPAMATRTRLADDFRSRVQLVEGALRAFLLLSLAASDSEYRPCANVCRQGQWSSSQTLNASSGSIQDVTTSGSSSVIRWEKNWGNARTFPAPPSHAIGNTPGIKVASTKAMFYKWTAGNNREKSIFSMSILPAPEKESVDFAEDDMYFDEGTEVDESGGEGMDVDQDREEGNDNTTEIHGDLKRALGSSLAVWYNLEVDPKSPL